MGHSESKKGPEIRCFKTVHVFSQATEGGRGLQVEALAKRLLPHCSPQKFSYICAKQLHALTAVEKDAPEVPLITQTHASLHPSNTSGNYYDFNLQWSAQRSPFFRVLALLQRCRTLGRRR